MYFKSALLLFISTSLILLGPSCAKDESTETEAATIDGIYLAQVKQSGRTSPRIYEIASTKTGINITDYCSSEKTLEYVGTTSDNGITYNLTQQTTTTDTVATDAQAVLTISPEGAPGKNILKLAPSAQTDNPYWLNKQTSYACETTGASLRIVTNSEASDAACTDWGDGNGRNNLKCATSSVFSQTLNSGTTITGSEEAFSTETTITIGDEDHNLLCTTTTSMTETANIVFSDTPLLTSTTNVYPGGVLYGNNFLNTGSFDSIDVSSGYDSGTIDISGINLGDNVSSYISVEELSYSNIQEAVQERLSESSGLASSGGTSVSLFQVQSEDDLKLNLGITEDISSSSSPLNFNWGEDDTKNYFLIKISQTFYTVSLETPATSYAFFNTDADNQFDDTKNALTKNNPPVYVSDFDIGRVAYIKIATPLSSDEVQAILLSDVDGVEDDLDISASDFLAISTVVVATHGGKADEALALSNAAAGVGDTSLPAAISTYYNAGVNYTASELTTDGAVTHFSLRYLGDSSIVSSSMEASYEATSCTTTSASAALRLTANTAKYDFKMQVTNVDDTVYFIIDNSEDLKQAAGDGSADVFKYFTPPVSLDDPAGACDTNTPAVSCYATNAFTTFYKDATFNDSDDHTIRLQLNNNKCGDVSYSYNLFRAAAGTGNYTLLSSQIFSNWGFCNWWHRAVYKINRQTGLYDFLQVGQDIVW